jgi:uncharacterized protein (DUF58 family)
LSFAATTNNDKVGLLIFTDRVELFIPPRKGRRHVLRVIRELLAFQPEGYGTDIKLSLDTVNRVLKRRSIVFLVSDFLVDIETYRQIMFVTNRRHDVIAIDLHDPLETNIAGVGLLALEDAESGELMLIDTSNQAWRQAFTKRIDELEQNKARIFARTGVDHIKVTTDRDYVLALTLFFQQRARRLRRV